MQFFLLDPFMICFAFHMNFLLACMHGLDENKNDVWRFVFYEKRRFEEQCCTRSPK